jgi:hypothetical protein
MFVLGAFTYNSCAGPIAWNGLFAFLVPFCNFGFWMTFTLFGLFRAIKQQDTMRIDHGV